MEISTRQINTCDKYNLDNLKLEKPIKIDDVYVATVNFNVQTPKLSVNKNSKKLKVNLEKSLETLLNNFDNKIISELSNKSKDLFEDEFNQEELEEIYKSSYKSSKMNLHFSKNLTIYNKYKEILEINSISTGDNIICLINCTQIIFYKYHCEPIWEVYQIKLKETKLDTNKYLFVDDINDTFIDKTDSININLIKQIKIKN